MTAHWERTITKHGLCPRNNQFGAKVEKKQTLSRRLTLSFIISDWPNNTPSFLTGAVTSTLPSGRWKMFSSKSLKTISHRANTHHINSDLAGFSISRLLAIQVAIDSMHPTTLALRASLSSSWHDPNTCSLRHQHGSDLRAGVYDDIADVRSLQREEKRRFNWLLGHSRCNSPTTLDPGAQIKVWSVPT